MNFEQLYFIIEVAKSGSLSRAAAKLNISQSALSQALTKAEAELGAQIFTRSRLGTTPTYIGDNIIRKAIEILDKWEEMKMEADTSFTGKLSIGTVSSSLSTYLPKTLSSFKKDYPNIHFEITEKESHDIIDGITKDELDIGIIDISGNGKNVYNKEIEYKIILSGIMIAAVNKYSPLATSESVTPQEILKYPLAVSNTWTKKFVNKLESRYGAANILFSTDNHAAIQSALLENVAITLTPDYMLKNFSNVENGKIVPVKVVNFEKEYHNIALIWSKSSRHMSIVNRFISKLSSDLNDIT